METEFIPKFSNIDSKSNALRFLIETSIKDKLLKEVEEMSLEEKNENLYLPIQPEIPKTKKGIEKAIDKVIADSMPLEDGGEGLLESLSFFDNEPPYNERRIYKALQKQIEYTEIITKEGYREDTLITPGEEVIKIVRTELNKLNPEELNDLWVFGIIVTEEESKENIKRWVDINASNATDFLFYYALRNWRNIMGNEEPEDAITYSAKKVYEVFTVAYKKRHPEYIEKPEELKDYKERATKAVKDYPKEAQAYCRGWVMLTNNYSERAVMATVKAILK